MKGKEKLCGSDRYDSKR